MSIRVTGLAVRLRAARISRDVYKRQVEKPQEPQTDVAIYALYLYRRDTVPLIRRYLDEGNAPDAPGHFPEWLYSRREVGVYLFEGECIDIGTPEAYKEVCERFAGK